MLEKSQGAATQLNFEIWISYTRSAEGTPSTSAQPIQAEKTAASISEAAVGERAQLREARS